MKSYWELSMKEKDEIAEKRFERIYAKDRVEAADPVVETQEVPLPHLTKGRCIVYDANFLNNLSMEYMPIDDKLAAIARDDVGGSKVVYPYGEVPRPIPTTTGIVPGQPKVVNVYPSGVKKVAVIATDDVGGTKVVYPYGDVYLDKSTEPMAEDNPPTTAAKVSKRPRPIPTTTGIVPGQPKVVNVYPSGVKNVAVIVTDDVGGSKVVYPYGEVYLDKSTEPMAEDNPPPTAGTNLQGPCEDHGESTVIESPEAPSAAAPGASSSDYN